MMPKATNSLYLKELNRNRILKSLRQSPCSRAELAKRTSLSRGAISLITEELISEGILVESEKVYTEVGRRPVIIKLNATRFYSLGVSIARDRTMVGLIDFDGTVAYAKKIADFEDAQASLNVIAAEINHIIAERNISFDKLLGIGISAPGPLSVQDGKILEPPNLEKWHNFPICEYLQQMTNLPVYLENNSSALAMAEKHYGHGEKFSSMMVMIADTGIGAGIILNQELFRGDGGFGSEVGHICVDVHGDLCACGNRGCLELYVKRSTIIKKAQAISPEYNCWDKIVDSAIDGDTDCIQLLDYVATYLAVGIVNMLNLFDMEAVVLTGDISYKSDLLLSNLRQKVNAWAIARNIRKIPLFISKLTGDVEVLCAALVALEKYFSE